MELKKNLFLHIFLFNLFLFISIYLNSIGCYVLFSIECIYSFWYFKAKIFFPILLFSVPIWFMNFDYSKQIENSSSYQGKIVKNYGTSMYVEIEDSNYYLLLDDEFENKTYEVGQTIKFSCSSDEFSKVIDNDSFKAFLKSNKTEYYCYVDSAINIIEEENNTIRSNLYENIMSDDTLYAQYAQYMIYGVETDENEEIISTVEQLGVISLFVISGMQITFLFKVVNAFFSKVTKAKTFSHIITSILIFWLVYLLFFPPPAIRAWMCSTLYFFLLNFKYIKFRKNDILSIVALIFFAYNPYLFLQAGILLSFGITFLLNTISDLEIRKTNKIFLSSFAAFSFSIIIVSTFETTFNLTSPLLIPFLSPLLTLGYILIIFTLPFQFLWQYVSLYFELLNLILQSCTYLIYTILISNLNSYYLIFLFSIFNLNIHFFNTKTLIHYWDLSLIFFTIYSINCFL